MDVDYESPDFERGMTDGLNGHPCAQPTDESYYEGWLMGDAERYCASHPPPPDIEVTPERVLRELERALAGEFDAIEVNADTPDDRLDEFLFGPWLQ